jgi:hypothetical protein
MQSLKGLELRGDTCRESANGHVADVAEEMLNADFFGLFGLYYGRSVYKSLGGGSAVL